MVAHRNTLTAKPWGLDIKGGITHAPLWGIDALLRVTTITLHHPTGPWGLSTDHIDTQNASNTLAILTRDGVPVLAVR